MTISRRPTDRWRAFAPGQRVVVRRRRDDSPSPDEPRLTDLVGEVVEITTEGLSVAARQGTTWIPAADIVAARQVPQAP